MCGIVAAGRCFRAFLHLHGGLGWGRDALFDMRISPWQKSVTCSCPGHHRTRVFTGDHERGRARMRGIMAAGHCFRAFLNLHGDLRWGKDAPFDMRISP